MKTGKELEQLVNELANVLKEGNENADKMCLPSESQERASELHERAKELVNEITGYEWNFTWLTWY